MRALLAIGVAGAAILAAGAAQAAPSIEFNYAAARVTVIPQQRADVKVVIQATNKDLSLQVRTEGEKTIVDGDLRNKIRSCDARNGKIFVKVTGVGQVAYENFPQVIVYVPMNAQVGASGAVFGSVGRTDSLTLSNAGCGDWTVGNVGGDLKLNIAGSGDTKVGSAGGAVINLAGSGDVAMGAVSRDLAVKIGGSGDVAVGNVGSDVSIQIGGSGDTAVASVNGQVNVSIAGSGDVAIRSGQASALSASIAGSGDVLFGGTAGTVSAKIAGSGDVHVARVTGPVSKSVVGSGGVVVGPVEFDD